MKKELKDFIHLYLGCQCQFETDTFILDGIIGGQIVYSTESDESGEGIYDIEDIKPILRKLSDMTEEETNEFNMIYYDEQFETEYQKIITNAKATSFLLSKHFDIFNLIPSGLAIDSKTLKEKI
jgi:hypothetical protein